MMRRKKIILSVLGLLLLIGGLAAAIFIVGKQVIFKNKAFTETGTANLTVSPSSGTKNVGDVFLVNFRFDTVGASSGASMVQFVFSFPSNLDLVNASGSPVNQLTVDPAFAATGSKWTFSFNSVTRNAGTVTVQFSGTYNDITGYTTAAPVTIATAYLKAVSPGTANFTFDANNSLILTKGFPTQDIMKTPAPVSFTISSGTTPGVGEFIFPATATIPIGTTPTPIQVKVNTGGVAISSLSFRLNYSSPTLEALSISPDATLVSSADWAFPVKTVTTSGGVVTIDFAGVNSSVTGFTSSTDVNLATINFKANSIPATNPVVLSFDATKTSILSKASPPVEILQMPTNLSYTIVAACPAGETYCGSVCKNLQTDITNCGVCNHTCSSTQTCTNGTCIAIPNPTLSFGFKVQGVSTAGITKSFAVTVKGTTTSVLSQTLTSGTNGIFRATNVTMPNVGTTVDIFVKSSNTLKKKLGSMNLIPGTNTAPIAWESIVTTTGDFDENNIFNITDIAKMLQNYNALSTPVTSANGLGLYDVDNDNSYTLKDLAIILSNFTDLSKPGD